MLIIICHTDESGEEFDFVNYKVEATKVCELFANKATHFLPNTCFSEQVVVKGGMVGKFKSIYSHNISLAPADAVQVSKACVSELVKPGGIDTNIAIAARKKLEEMSYKFIKVCGHKSWCLCEEKGIGNVPLLTTNEACTSRNHKKRTADEVESEAGTSTAA